MNKADLKKSWGRYCDTDKLTDDMMALLTKYHHRNTEHGVCTILNKFFLNKRELIDMLTTSTHYNGDMRIVLDVELERTNSTNEVRRCCCNFLDKIKARDAIVKTMDDKGKTIKDYLKTGRMSFCAKDFLDAKLRKSLTTNVKNLSQFDFETGETLESIKSYDELNTLLSNGFGNNPFSTLSKSVVDAAANLKTPIDLAEGMKTSRAFNKVCVAYGLDKINPTETSVVENGELVTKTTYPYDKFFAQYADLVSGHKRNMKFFISVNPLDYLTMSLGNSWTSCHSIERGGWKGGCVSYMLDNSSIITYAHCSMPESVEEGKVYRNMFHYHNGALLQSRIYPKENDGLTNLYKVFMSVVRNEISSLIGVSKDSWTRIKGNYLDHVTSVGKHYRDYNNYDRFTFSYSTEIDGAADSVIDIGHNPICACCGREDYGLSSGSLSHNNC